MPGPGQGLSLQAAILNEARPDRRNVRLGIVKRVGRCMDGVAPHEIAGQAPPITDKQRLGADTRRVLLPVPAVLDPGRCRVSGSRQAAIVAVLQNVSRRDSP
jgi:hypothetical protein